MNIKPLGDRVLVQSDKAEDKTAGGIFLPLAQQERITNGIVLAVGTDEKIPVKIGDRVIYDRAAGVKIKKDGEEFLIFKVEELFGVIEN